MQAHAHHIVPAKVYAVILTGLLVLTAVTVGAASFKFGSPAVSVIVALGIATVKASLVALYFMHLRYDKPMSAIILVAGLGCLAIFLMACFGDTSAREVIQPATRSVAVAAPAAAR